MGGYQQLNQSGMSVVDLNLRLSILLYLENTWMAINTNVDL